MTTGSTDLDAILTGSEARDVIEETVEAIEATETENTHVSRDATGELTTATPPVAEKPPESKPEEKPAPGHVPYQALADERRKRQELEQRLAQLEQKAPEAKPNLFEDPDGWEKALDERISKRTAEVDSKAEQRFLVLVEQAAKARHADFEDVAKVFAETARVTPGLIEEARQAADPAEFIYQAGRNLKRVQEAGSIEALIAQAEARGEERARQALTGKAPPKIPESLTDIAGTGERAPQAFTPKPLSELLPTY